jgi:hypothetical protein
MARTTTTAADTKLAAARAEFNARKAAAAKTADVSPLKATVVDEPTEAKADVWAQLKDALAAVQAEYGVLSWKRYVCSLLVSMAASFATGYIGGMVINAVLSMSFIATSAFMSWAVLIIGILMSIAAGVFVGRKAFNYIASEHIDLHYAVAKGAVVGAGRWVGSLFGFGANEPAASNAAIG